jgi:hypothetical protein
MGQGLNIPFSWEREAEKGFDGHACAPHIQQETIS